MFHNPFDLKYMDKAAGTLLDAIANGEKINNYEIPIRIAYTLGTEKNQFPVSVVI